MEQTMVAQEPVESIDAHDPMYQQITDQVMEAAEAPGFTPIGMPPNVVVELPGGIIRLDGSVVSQATVRELTGLAEEKMARYIAKNDVAGYFNTIIEFGVESPQFEEPERASMLFGDRTALLIGIRRATFGDTYDMGNYTCGGEDPEIGCGSELHIEVDLAKDIPVRKLDSPLDRYITVGSKYGKLKFRLPTVSDVDAADTDPNATDAQRNTILLSKCLVEMNNSPIEAQAAPPEKIVQSLGMKARRDALKAIVDKQPGPQLAEVEVKCPDCGFETTALVDVVATFR